jgi:PAS domain S-box-containing protein
VNPAFCELVGFTREELIGDRPPHLFWPQQDATRLTEAIGRALAGESWERDCRLVRNDGQRLDVIVTASPLVDDDGHVQGCVTTVKDISGRKSGEAALRRHAENLARLARQLKRSNEELDQFAYVTSHDLKAPLRGIANLSQWIEEDLGDRFTPEGHRQMNLLRGRVHRMEALIDGLLRYSRIDRAPMKGERVDTRALLRDVIDLLSPPAGFLMDVSPDLPTLTTTRLALQQVFMNLVGNAIKHHDHPEHGRVRVTAEDAGEFYEFRVTDDGPGIDPTYHEKVFIIFQTLEPRDKVEGTGIGLAIVKKTVERFGGTIRVESAPGRGATFAFTWPKQPPQGDSGEQ